MNREHIETLLCGISNNQMADVISMMVTLSTMLDQALDALSSFASYALYAALTAIQALSVFTGLKPELIAAGVGGFFIFVVVLKLGFAVK